MFQINSGHISTFTNVLINYGANYDLILISG